MATTADVTAELHKILRTGNYEVGAEFLSIGDVMVRFNAAFGTARKSLRNLADDGLIEISRIAQTRSRSPGRGNQLPGSHRVTAGKQPRDQRRSVYPRPPSMPGIALTATTEENAPASTRRDELLTEQQLCDAMPDAQRTLERQFRIQETLRQRQQTRAAGALQLDMSRAGLGVHRPRRTPRRGRLLHPARPEAAG
jgi:hypothetical protein